MNITLSIIRYLAFACAVIKSSSAFSSQSSKRVFIGTPAHKARRPISDCMTPIQDLIILTESSTVDEAVNLLLKLGVSGAPVIESKTGELVGIVSSFDFLQQEAGEGTLLPPIEGDSNKEAVESYLSAAKKICAKKVGDLMTTNIRTMVHTDSMRDAAALMAQEKLHRLPIVNEDGTLVGMLTSSDVMIDMVHIARSLPPAKEESFEETNNNNNHDLSP
jgi:CBS domain-containing protein